VQEINRLLKQYQDMADMMKKMKKLGPKGVARHGLAGLMPGEGVLNPDKWPAPCDRSILGL